MKAIIIEDEESSQITLRNMLTDYCHGVEIVGIADSVGNGVRLINANPPDLIFLDIEMPGQNGFKLFDYFPKPEFGIVFTTAYNEYALKALKMSAADYLLKPIALDELRIAISKVKEKKELLASRDRWKILKGNIDRTLQKLALPTNEGYEFINIQDITRCEAIGNYTNFYLSDNRKILVSKTLKLFADILEEHFFFRISRSQLVNLRFIKKFGRQKSPTLTMVDGSVLNVSTSRKDELLLAIDSLI